MSLRYNDSHYNDNSVALELDDSLDMEESLLNYIDGHTQTHASRRPGKRIGGKKKRGGNGSNNTGTPKDTRLITKENTHSEVVLESLLWYVKALFWLMVFLVLLMIAVVAGTIITAVRVTPEAAGMLRGMSRNVTNMAALSTNAPDKMAEAWVNMGGDEILAHGKSILNRTHHILTRIDGDPNLNDQLFTTVKALSNKALHVLDTVTDGEWVQGKAHVMSLLQQADAWSTSISPDLVRDTLQNGRDLSSEATTLLQEARRSHLIETLNHAGLATSQLEDRMAQLNEITIKLPPAAAVDDMRQKQQQRPQKRRLAR